MDRSSEKVFSTNGKFIFINTEMAKLCKFAQLKIIKNAGHNIHFENTLVFVENIKYFLSTAS